jgi:hypothetical protein
MDILEGTPIILKRFSGVLCSGGKISAWERYSGNVDRIQEGLDIKGGNDEKTTYGPVVVSRHRCGCLLQDE